MDYAKESLRLHGEWKGKIEVVTRVPAENKDDLSLAYKAQPIAQEHEEHHQETLGVYRSVLDQFDNQERQVIGRFLTKLAEKIED